MVLFFGTVEQIQGLRHPLCHQAAHIPCGHTLHSPTRQAPAHPAVFHSVLSSVGDTCSYLAAGCSAPYTQLRHSAETHLCSGTSVLTRGTPWQGRVLCQGGLPPKLPGNTQDRTRETAEKAL